MSLRHRFGRFTVLVGLSLVAGAVIGLIATIYHGAVFPLGLSLSVVIVATFLAGLRALWRTRLLALAGALGALGVVAFGAGADRSGSVLIMADAAGLSFVIAVTFVTAVALAWPKFSARPASYDRDAGIPERTLPQ